MPQALSRNQKYFRLAWAYLRRRPMWVTWQATYNCNFRCKFCFYWKNEIPRKEESSLEDFAIGARKLAELGSTIINLAGGEPFLRPDLPEIVSILNQHHVPCVTTNGWFITRELACRMWQAGLWGASVSLDYASAERHDTWRGMPGSFERALAALQYLADERRELHQRVSVLCLLNHDNLDELEPLIQLAQELDVYFLLQPYSTAKTRSRAFLAKENVSERLLRLREKYPNFLSNAYYLAKFDQYYAGGVPNCQAGEAFLNIDNRMNVSVCVEEVGGPIGKLTELSMGDILKALRARAKNNTCTLCWYSCRGESEVTRTWEGFKSSIGRLAQPTLKQLGLESKSLPVQLSALWR